MLMTGGHADRINPFRFVKAIIAFQPLFEAANIQINLETAHLFEGRQGTGTGLEKRAGQHAPSRLSPFSGR